MFSNIYEAVDEPGAVLRLAQKRYSSSRCQLLLFWLWVYACWASV